MLNERLTAAISIAAGTSDASRLHILQCSSANATGAIIFHVWLQSEKHPRLIIKTPRLPESQHSIDLEWQIVTDFNESNSAPDIIPRAVSQFEADGNTFYSYRGIPGRTMFARYRDRIFLSRDRMQRLFYSQALLAAKQVHESSSELTTSEQLAGDLRRDLDLLAKAVPQLPGPIRKMAMKAADEIARSAIQLPAGRIHGDFSPYNLMTATLFARDCTGLIDWEHSEEKRPQYLDIFRFIAASELMGRKARDDGRALMRMSEFSSSATAMLWRPWLSGFTADTEAAGQDQRLYSSLWTHFWIHAALREQLRQADPTDLSQCTFVRGLAELAS